MKTRFLFLIAAAMLFYGASNHYTLLEVDTGKSEILWKCDKHNGFFPLDSGYVYIDENNVLQKGKFYIGINDLQVLDLDSADYKTAKMILENTLKNEFFEVKKYPLAYFDLQKVIPEGERYLLEGDLHMHGTDVCIRFYATYHLDPQADMHLTSETFKIDRTDWGIYRLSPQRPYPDDAHGWTVPDTVEIKVKLKFHLP